MHAILLTRKFLLDTKLYSAANAQHHITRWTAAPLTLLSFAFGLSLVGPRKTRLD